MSGKSWSEEVILKHPILWPEYPSSPVLHGLGQRPTTRLKALPPGFCICSAAWSLSCFLTHQAKNPLTVCTLSVAITKVTDYQGFKTQNPSSRETLSLGQTRAVHHPSTTQRTEATFGFQVLPFNDGYISSRLIPLKAETWTSRTNIHTCAHLLPVSNPPMASIAYRPAGGLQSPPYPVWDLPFLTDFKALLYSLNWI